MSSVVVNIKTEENVKKQAQNIASELGLSLSSLINAYLRQLVRTRRIEFDLGEEPSHRLIKAMKKAEENLKKGNHSPIFRTGKKAIEWLEKQGI